MRRYCLFMAMAFMVAAVQSAWADDNQIAQFIVQKLKAEQQQGNLQGFHVDMRVDRGTVWFKGFVSNPQQELLILRTAQQAGMLGVVQIVDDIDVQAAAPVMSQAAAMPSPPAPQAMAQEHLEMNGPAPMANAMLIPARETYGQQAALPVGYMQDVGPTAISQAPLAVGPQTGGPMPVAQMAMNGGMGLPADNPQLPGYAWPGYAAAPNYAAVTYPRQYSASAWPYIGPFYPYPQVPLGWRKVTLEWDDGWWYLDFNDRHH